MRGIRKENVKCTESFFYLQMESFLPTSSDHVVDSDNIFIVDVAVVILHTDLCISCRCTLNKTNNELTPASFMLLYYRN